MISRAIYLEIAEGRDRRERATSTAAAGGGQRLCDQPARRRRAPGSPEGRSRPSCPTSPTSAAPTWASIRSSSRCRPAHGPLRHGRHPHRQRRPGAGRRQHALPEGCTPPASAPASVGARRQPAGHQLAGGPGGLRPAGGRDMAATATSRHAPLPENPRPRCGPSWSGCWPTPRASAAKLRRSDAGSDDDERGRVPHRPSCMQRGAGQGARAEEAASPTSTSPTRASASTPTCWRPGSWATCWTWPRPPRCRRWQPHREPRRPRARRLSRSATTPTGSSTPSSGTEDGTTYRTGYKPVTIGRYQPKRASTRPGPDQERCDASHTEDPALQPRDWMPAALGEYDVDVEPNDQLLDALNKVKWYHDGTLTYRRSCAHGICGSDAMASTAATAWPARC
jgi:hypothetical protein